MAINQTAVQVIADRLRGSVETIRKDCDYAGQLAEFEAALKEMVQEWAGEVDLYVEVPSDAADPDDQD